MAPVFRARPLRKDGVRLHFKTAKPVTLSENPRPSNLAPNIRSVSWSPAGTLVANCTTVNIRVWNPERPDVRASTALQDVPKGGAHTSAVEKVTFNPRLESLLASSALDGTVKVWDVRTPSGAAIIGGGGLNARGSTTSKSGECKLEDQSIFLTWHPSGMELLVGNQKDKVTALDLRRADTNIFEATPSTTHKYDLIPTDRTPVKDKGAFYQMSFTNSGKHLLAPTTEGPVKVMTYPNLKTVHNLTGHASTTYCALQSPAGSYIAVGGADSTITLWDTSSWLVTHVLRENAGAVRDISFSHDGAYLTAGGGIDTYKEHEKGLHIWHVDTGELVHTIDTTNAPTVVAWHPLRYAVAYAGDPGGMKIVGSLSGS